ncbi:hypothetical protein L2E82_32544 [Cichorium intybus]|uniref:Uncharacterized protein n=1 Tax=Cichorium intybus TaxID=13427 RepID=A0ACB9BHI3_CICIN|nr:hypothetical protein L2E82_32544 [Cichorium intybus]
MQGFGMRSSRFCTAPGPTRRHRSPAVVRTGLWPRTRSWSTRSCYWSSSPLSSSHHGQGTRVPGSYVFVWEVSTGSATSGSLGGAHASTLPRTSSTDISPGSSGPAFRGSRTGLPTWRFGHHCPTSGTRRRPRGRATYAIHSTASCTGSSPPPSCSGREARRCRGTT